MKKRATLRENEWNEKSLKIQEKVLDADFYRKSGSILLYCHFDREVKTDLLLTDALNCGKIVCIPYQDWNRKILIPSRIGSLDEIDRTLKIPQPFISIPFPLNKIGLVIIPGVVFDVYGNRIGMGQGFYDRLMEKIGQDVHRVSIAFDFQVIDEKLPVDSLDKKVDVIITESRTLSCR